MGKTFVLLLFCCVVKASADDAANNTAALSFPSRQPRLSILRFMSPFATVDNCRTTAGLSGSCLSSQDCTKRGGRGIETCAYGLGVCCVFTGSCGSSSSANNTYFTSPDYPSSWTAQENEKIRVCTFTLRRQTFAPRICQYRLDFDDFYINGPDGNGQCSRDMFGVTGQDLNNIVPNICGLNSGQHMYVNVGSIDSPVRLTITVNEERTERKWKIRVTQIKCGSDALAPPFCLQYFTTAVGRIQSFNYGNSKATENFYSIDQNYAICIRKEAAMCGANFATEGDFAVDGERTLSTCGEGDFLTIGTTTICGTGSLISGEVNKNPNFLRHSNNGPMMLTFITDNQPKTDVGFNLRFMQFSCSSNQG